jgi:hypothetical protein
MRADEDRVRPRELRLRALRTVGDPALCHDDAVAGGAGDELELRLTVDRERGEVARVHAHDLGAERDRPLELDGVMRFDEGVQTELLGCLRELVNLGVAEVAEQQKHGVRAGGAHVLQLLARAEEPLGEERERRCSPRGPLVGERPAEALVHQDRDRRGTTGRERPGKSRRIGIGPKIARRRRAALHLGDRREPRRRERVAEAPHYASPRLSSKEVRSGGLAGSSPLTPRAQPPGESRPVPGTGTWPVTPRPFRARRR